MKSLIAILTFVALPALAQESTKPELRQRKHHITWSGQSITSESEVAVGTNPKVKSTSTTTKNETTYGYQIKPQIQPYVGFATESNSGTSAKSQSISLGLIGQLFPNEPGNDLIPFVFAEFSIVNAEVNVGSTVSLSGNGNLGGIGLDYYPFGELVAMRAKYAIGGAELTGSSTAGSIKAALNPKGLTFEFVIAF